MKFPLKLPGWVPRLTRRQRVARNLTAFVLALFFTWVVLDFTAPTLGIAAQWKAAQYGLPAPKVVYCPDGAGGDGILQWEDGRLALTKCYFRTLSWSLGDFWFTEPEDGYALLVPDMYEHEPVYLVYFWTDRTDFFRAEASLRIETEVNVKISDSVGNSEEGHYDWDETYEMEAVPDQHGFCRFEIPLKYDENVFRLQAAAERSAFHEFSWTVKTNSGVNRAAEFTVSFYNENGMLLDTWEKELYNDLREEGTL